MATDITRVNGALPQNKTIDNQTVEIRKAGIAFRKKLTDAIQVFNRYVDSKGVKSTQPDRAYPNYTRKIYAKRGLNKAMVDARYAGKVGRDVVSDDDLIFIQAAENLAANLFLEGVGNGDTREKIKSTVDRRITKLAEAHETDELGVSV